REQWERVEMRMIRDVQLVADDRRDKGHGLEEIGAMAREDREPVQRARNRPDVLANASGIVLEAAALGAARPVGLDSLGKFLPEKRVEAVPAALVRPKVGGEAEDRDCTGIEGGQFVELDVQLIESGHTASLRKPYARDEISDCKGQMEDWIVD